MPYGDGIVTDRDQVVTATAYPTTTVNTLFQDLDFDLDTNIVAKNSSPSTAPHVEYSQYQAFNLDSTYIWISGSGGSVYYAPFNTATGLVGSWTQLTGAIQYTVCWSGLDANKIWYVKATDNKLYSRDVSTATDTMEFDFPAYFTSVGRTGATMGQTFVACENDSYMSGEYRPASGNMEDRRWFLLRLSDMVMIKDALMMNGANPVNGANDVHVNPNGTFVYLCSNYSATLDSEVQQIYDIGTDTLYNFGIRFQAPNYDCGFGHMDLGNDYLVGENANGNGIVATALSLLASGGVSAFRTGGVKIFEAEYHTLSDSQVVALGQHVCYKSGSWALISHYDHRTLAERAADPTNANYDVTFDEILLAKVDVPNFASAQIKRVAKTHVLQNGGGGPGTYNYDSLPRASISPDLTYIAFNTTLDVENGDTSVVVTRLPSLSGGGDPGFEDSPDFQLRVRIEEYGGLAGASTDDFQLYYSLNSGAYAAVTGSTPVKFFNSTHLTEGEATTNRLSSTSFSAGKVTEDAVVDNLLVPADGSTELLASLTLDVTQLEPGDTIDFQFRRNGAVLDTYDVVPRVTVEQVVPYATENDTLPSNETKSFGGSFSNAETGAGTESRTLDATLGTVGETGAGTESHSVVPAYTASDVWSSTESSVFGGNLSGSEGWTGTDSHSHNGSNPSVNQNETFSSTEGVSLSGATPPSSETGLGSESTSAAGASSQNEAFTGTENQLASTAISQNESFSSTEGQATAPAMSQNEAFSSTEGQSASGGLSKNEAFSSTEGQSESGQLTANESLANNETKTLAGAFTGNEAWTGTENNTNTGGGSPAVNQNEFLAYNDSQTFGAGMSSGQAFSSTEGQSTVGASSQNEAFTGTEGQAGTATAGVQNETFSGTEGQSGTASMSRPEPWSGSEGHALERGQSQGEGWVDDEDVIVYGLLDANQSWTGLEGQSFANLGDVNYAHNEAWSGGEGQGFRNAEDHGPPYMMTVRPNKAQMSVFGKAEMIVRPNKAQINIGE